MKLLNLNISNFGALGEEVKVDFTRYTENDKILIVGINQDAAGADSNGAGKTTFLNAISWAIFGRTPNDISSDDVIRRGCSSCSVTLGLVDESENEIIIKRKRKRGGGHQVQWFLNGDSQTQRTMQQTQKTLLNYFGILENNTEYYSDFLNTTYFSIEAVKAFAGKRSTSKQRMDLISRFLNLEVLDRCTSKAKVYFNNLKGELQTHRGQIEFLEGKLSEGINPAQLISDSEGYKVDIKQYQVENKKLSKEIVTLKQIADLYEQMGDIEASIERTQADLNTIVEVYSNQVEDLKNKQSNLPNLKGEIEKLEQLSTTKADALKDKDLNKYREWLNEGRIILARKKDKIEDLEIQLRDHLKCPECDVELMLDNGGLIQFDKTSLSSSIKKEKAEHTKKVKAFHKKEKEFTALCQLESELNETDLSIKGLYKELNELHDIPIKIKELETTKASKTKKSQDYLKELAKKKLTLNLRIRKYSGLASDVDLLGDMETTVESNKQNIDELKDQIARNEMQITAYQADKASFKKLMDKEGEISQAMGEYQYWTEGFPAIRRWMIESFLPSFEQQTNSYLNRMEVGMRVRFDTIKEKKSKRGEFKQEFDLSIIDEHNEKRDLETYSGGESKRIGICVGFALRELTLTKGYSNFNFLLMDEVIDSLDETGIGEFFNLLNNVTGRKLLITHNTDLKTRFGNVIKVVKQEGKSHIIQ
jgi:DNA repair exonuclease SbcCD ATPase subunit